MAFQNDSVHLLVSGYRACYFNSVGLYIIPSYTAVWTILLFTLSFLVLHSGFQKWRQSKRAPAGHSDFFTYNTLFLEVIRYCGYFVYSVGSLQSEDRLIIWGLRLIIMVFPGLLTFHLFICIERYVAVVYPVAYLSLKKRQWFWIRKLVIVNVWAFCVLWISLLYVMKPLTFYVSQLSVLGPAASLIIFCSAHVLYSLRNPSPGERGGVSRAKRNAFKTILFIFFALMLWLVEAIVRILLHQVRLLDQTVMCKLLKSACWFEFPSGLVLPLLFLHRYGVRFVSK